MARQQARPELNLDHTKWRAGRLIGDAIDDHSMWITHHYEVRDPYVLAAVKLADDALIKAALTSIGAMLARNTGKKK
jgi:hypothetical protein